MNYPGVVKRQTLVEWLQSRVSTCQREASELWNAAEHSVDEQEQLAFLNEYSCSLVKQLAYREVAEWAKKQVEADGEQH